jgi:uncharacterized RmlC-like cupin family protein
LLVIIGGLVMGNATFHKGGRIEELIQDAGCQLLYLPPYSPDLNKIEQRRVLVEESNPQKTGSGKSVYEMPEEDVLRYVS